MENPLLAFLARNPDFVVDSPISVPITKTRKFILNMNVYRNTHFYSLNKAKETYRELVSGQVEGLPVLRSPLFVYKLYPSRLCDVSNICCVHSKFFLDTLVSMGKLSDDNFNVVPIEIYQFCSKVKKPKLEIYIYENCIRV